MKLRLFQKLCEIGIIIFGMVFFGYYITSPKPVDTLVVKNSVTVQSDETVEISLDGEVRFPGTYTVPLGTRLHDVIYKAGGVTPNADLSSFDLSAPIVKDTNEYIPQHYDGIVVESRTIQSNSDPELGSDAAEVNVNRININTASADELSELPAIGSKIAGRIVDYRILNGNFSSTEDIKNVKGIGDKTFEKIKDRITVGE